MKDIFLLLGLIASTAVLFNLLLKKEEIEKLRGHLRRASRKINQPGKGWLADLIGYLPALVMRLTEPTEKISRRVRLSVLFFLIFATSIVTNLITGSDTIYTNPGMFFSAADGQDQETARLVFENIKQDILNLETKTLYIKSFLFRFKLFELLNYPLFFTAYVFLVFYLHFYLCFVCFKFSIFILRKMHSSLSQGYDTFTLISHAVFTFLILLSTALLLSIVSYIISHPLIFLFSDGIIWLINLGPKVSVPTLLLGGLYLASTFPVWFKLVATASFLPFVYYFICVCFHYLATSGRTQIIRRAVCRLLDRATDYDSGPLTFLSALIVSLIGLTTYLINFLQ